MACDLCHTFMPMGSGTGRENASPTQCAQVACLACGTVQCFSHGLARGACSHCHFGRLPGWSFRVTSCQYAGCTAPAVYTGLPGARRECCAEHGAQVLARVQTRRAERTAKYARLYAR